MTVQEQIGNAGLVPVVVLHHAAQAVPVADALKAGGICAMEITLRTPAGIAAIAEMTEKRPEMLVGAGTVLTLEQCRACTAAGAKFIVSPGFDEQIVGWCVENGVTVIPGCVTPTEIMRALSFDLTVLKFFPANVYGGISAMKALSAPFGAIKFIATGGIHAGNLSDYASAPFIHAVGGSWMCTRELIDAGNYAGITSRSREALAQLHGFQFAHVGINASDEHAARALSGQLAALFHFPAREGNTSVFSGDSMEIMKAPYFGALGHIAVSCNQVERALAYLVRQDYQIEPSTAKYKNGRMLSVYLSSEFGGFAIHLLQKEKET